MKVKVRIAGTDQVVFEGEVESNCVWTDSDISFMRIDGMSPGIQIVVRDNVYVHTKTVIEGAAPVFSLHRFNSHIESVVFRALDNAGENGYAQQPDAQVEAETMVQEDADLERWHPWQLVPHIKRWREINE